MKSKRVGPPGKPGGGAGAAGPQVQRARHEVRIIGGQWKRTRLRVPDMPGLRPTPDRVRETLFNWLAHRAGGPDLTGWRCVDVFAGTGALGLEAASRGAQPVWLLERDAKLAAALAATVSRLGAAHVQVQRADGVAALRAMGEREPGAADLVLIDPPFEQPALYEAALAAARVVLAPGGLVYLEAAQAWPPERLAAAGWQRLRYLKAGQVHAHLLADAAAGDDAAALNPP